MPATAEASTPPSGSRRASPGIHNRHAPSFSVRPLTALPTRTVDVRVLASAGRVRDPAPAGLSRGRALGSIATAGLRAATGRRLVPAVGAARQHRAADAVHQRLHLGDEPGPRGARRAVVRARRRRAARAHGDGVRVASGVRAEGGDPGRRAFLDARRLPRERAAAAGEDRRSTLGRARHDVRRLAARGRGRVPT